MRLSFEVMVGKTDRGGEVKKQDTYPLIISPALNAAYFLEENFILELLPYL
jgi:hypothetical protein